MELGRRATASIVSHFKNSLKLVFRKLGNLLHVLHRIKNEISFLLYYVINCMVQSLDIDRQTPFSHINETHTHTFTLSRVYSV